MTIKFGVAGLGSVKDSEEFLQEIYNSGLRACEIAFTYGVYIKNQKDAERIGKKAKELGIDLSIHAPYWINLNSVKKEKIEASKKRILDCLKVGTWLGVKRVVFHAGYYGKMSKEESYENIKSVILDLQKIKKEKNYTPKLAPETIGKKNVFGSVEEIEKLVSETDCDFCIDFAHVLAREGNYRFKEVFDLFNNKKEIHIHFSGIEYGDKGEKKHIDTSKKEWTALVKNLPKNKNLIIICEAPFPVADAIEGLKIYKELNVTNI